MLEKVAAPTGTTTRTMAEIATDRFVMRPVRRSDTGLFALYAGDKRVAEATQGIPHPLPPGAADAFVTRAMLSGTDEDIWVMDGTRSGLAEVLGVISLKKMDRAQSEVACWVSQPIRKATRRCLPKPFRTIRNRRAS